MTKKKKNKNLMQPVLLVSVTFQALNVHKLVFDGVIGIDSNSICSNIDCYGACPRILCTNNKNDQQI